MAETTDEKYERITQLFLASMGNVEAPPEEYLSALHAAIQEIEIAIDAAQQDINALDGGGEDLSGEGV